MRFSTQSAALLLALSTPLINAAPARVGPSTRRQLSDILPIVDEVIMFDTIAFLDEATNTFKAPLRTFVHLAQFDLSPLTSGFTSLLEGLGIDIGDSANILADRLALFAAIGLPGKKPDVNIANGGCSGKEIELGSTDAFPDLGMSETIIDIGGCASSLTDDVPAIATVDLPFFDNRNFEATIFPSIPDGFGIISDVDDTIKISNVLDKVKLIKSTFLEEPKFVPGMPELYASLDEKLNNPAFVYLSGSPFQLYPVLREFVLDNYPAGPVILQNLTLIDVPGLIDFIGQDTATRDYKVAQIQKLNGQFPNKQFIGIGDSTQQDPEVYATIIKQFGPEFMPCIWIREVPEADNSAARFATAFEGVDPANFRTFADPAELLGIDVAAGQC